MPGPTITFPMQLPPQVRREFEAFVALLNEGYLYVEHKEDGTHGDITADTITLAESSASGDTGTITLIDQDGIEIVLEATNEGIASPGSQHALEVRVDGDRAVQIGLLAPNAIFGSGHGFFIQDRILGAGGVDPTWGYALSTGQQALLSGRSALGLTDTIEDKVILLVRPVGAPGAVSAYFIGPVSSLTLGTPVSLGRDTTGERFESGAFDNTVKAGTAFVLGPATASGVRLDLNSGVLEVRLGDDSGYAPVNAQYFFGVAHLASDGSVGSPSFTFQPDQDTGFYRVGSGQIGVALDASLGVLWVKPAGAIGYAQVISAGAFGAGAIGGSQLIIGRNTSGSGAASCLVLQRLGGTNQYLWSDTNGLWRTNTAAPLEDGSVPDTSGTVLGDQSSKRAAKVIFRERFDYDVSLEHVLNAPVFDFAYKDGRYNGETFTGITTDDSPVFGKDNGKSLNEVSMLGHLVQAIKAQQKQIEDLTSEVIALRKRVE